MKDSSHLNSFFMEAEDESNSEEDEALCQELLEKIDSLVPNDALRDLWQSRPKVEEVLSPVDLIPPEFGQTPEDCPWAEPPGSSWEPEQW